VGPFCAPITNMGPGEVFVTNPKRCPATALHGAGRRAAAASFFCL
jgi:hypothetical protein